MTVSVECKPRPHQTVVVHRPEHCQADQLVKSIAKINRVVPPGSSSLVMNPVASSDNRDSPNPPPPHSATASSPSTSATIPSSISSSPTSISSIAVLISSIAPTSPYSVTCIPPGVTGTSLTPPTAATSLSLSASSADVMLPSFDFSSVFTSSAGAVLSHCCCAMAWSPPL